jgi:hypothetical protein
MKCFSSAGLSFMGCGVKRGGRRGRGRGADLAQKNLTERGENFDADQIKIIHFILMYHGCTTQTPPSIPIST